MIYQLLLDNEQYYETEGLVDATTLDDPVPTYVNNATGQIQILDQNQQQLIIGPGDATTATLSYVAGSNGVYRALITELTSQPDDEDAPAGRGYTIIVDLTTPGGGVYHRELLAEVIVARGN
jgi:hypothetical protein